MKQRLSKRAMTSGRPDDDLQIVLNRIRIFHEISEAVVRSYTNILHTIDSDRDADQVFNDCCTLLDSIVGPGEGPLPHELPPPGRPLPPPPPPPGQ